MRSSDVDRWIVVSRGRLDVVVNLADRVHHVPVRVAGRALVATTGAPVHIGSDGLMLAACDVAVLGPAPTLPTRPQIGT